MGRFAFRAAGLFALVAMLAGAVTSYEDVADGLVSVFSPTGELVSQHREDRKALQSAFEHSIATGTEGVYRIVPPERRVTIRLLNPGGGGQGGPPPDAEPPLAPVGGALSNYQASSVQISWSSNGEPDVANYRVFKSTTSATSGFGVIATVEAPGTTYTDTEYNPAIQQWYRLTARDVSGNESAFSSTFTDITAPSAPSAPTVQTNGSTSQTLALPVSAALDHASYRVERSTNGTDYTQIATGVTASTYESTGLSSGVLYYHRLVDVDVSGNASAAGAAVSQTTTASGDNAARISAILAGRSPHFAYSTPADPVTTREVTVTSASQFNSEAATSGTRININSSFSGDVNITANDIDVVMNNGATITGNLNLGGGSYANRIRWTGGNLSGDISGVRIRDALFDDFRAVGSITHNLTAGWDGVGNPGFDRVAFINSTLQVTSGQSGSGWALYNSSSNPNSGLILANALLIGGTYQTTRFQDIDGIVIVDSVFNPDGAVGSGFRIHRESSNVWIKDSWARGIFNFNQVNTSDQGPSATNCRFDNFDRYAPDAAYAYTAPLPNPNTGTVLNSTLFTTAGAGSFPGITNFTDGGGNSRESWNGSTVPDYSGVGAIR